MDYREIVSVTGVSGLFQLMATKSDGAIVRNLADKSTRFIPARLHNVTPLESIEVYTTGENVRLHQVFEKMKEHEDVSLPDAKKADTTSIKSYFKQIFPEFDDERVYISDMKKMLKWFEILKQNDLLNFDFYKQQEEAVAQEETPSEEIAIEQPVDEKPAKKARAKKSADEEAAVADEEKPKKTARKKKSAEDDTEGEEKPAKKSAKKKPTGE
ncbi:MAG TPA: DUF5606 domain-containing protein [Flavipsychrobacter sp.]|nr:DUF5606 domain-containing protein [Flavipsychrobacter sp.]